MLISFAGRVSPLPDPLMRCPQCSSCDLWWLRHAWRCCARRKVRDRQRQKVTTLVPGCGYALGLSWLIRGVVVDASDPATAADRSIERVEIDPAAGLWLDAGVPIGDMLLQSQALRAARAGQVRLSWVTDAQLTELLAEAEWLDRQNDALSAYLAAHERMTPPLPDL